MSKIDTEKKTIDNLHCSNNNQKVEVESRWWNWEVVLLIDGSTVWKLNKVAETWWKTRAEVVYDAATKLVDSLYERNPKSELE